MVRKFRPGDRVVLVNNGAVGKYRTTCKVTPVGATAVVLGYMKGTDSRYINIKWDNPKPPQSHGGYEPVRFELVEGPW